MRPYPEALPGGRGRGWQVKPLPMPQGATDLVRKLMEVDGSNGRTGRCIRLHELMHAAITPVRAASDLCDDYGVHLLALQAAEDCRIMHAVSYMGDDGVLPRAAVAEYLGGFLSPSALAAHTGRWAEQAATLTGAERQTAMAVAVCCVVSCYGPTCGEEDDYTPLYQAARRAFGHEFARVINTIVNTICDQALFSPRGDRETVAPFTRSTVPLARLLSLLFPRDGGDAGPGGEAAGEDEPSPWATWGRMTIHEPPLDVDHQLRRLHRRVIVSDMGVDVRQPDRLLTDGQVFGLRRSFRGGTVLIDASGSMGLTADQVREIVAACPAALVACYGAGEEVGRLNVVARAGRMAPAGSAYRPGGCNVVDGPALDWLNHQPEPRIWISDGHVTGVGDASSVYCDLDAARLVSAGRVQRVGDVAEAIAALVGRRAVQGV